MIGNYSKKLKAVITAKKIKTAFYVKYNSFTIGFGRSNFEPLPN